MTPPIRILYIDDYPHDRELVRDALEKEHGGFQVVEAASRADFEARLAEDDYNLVLSDFNILGFEGLQVIETVHAQKPGVPVLIVTGTGSEEVAVEAMKRGACDYVIKTPQHIRRLPHTIRAELKKKRLADEHSQLRQERDRLFDGLQRSNVELALAYDATIEGWSRALDLRDKETEGHSQRVTDLTVKLARALGIAEEALVPLRRGALLHDIGKMGVPDYILFKPGPLAEAEWVIMRQHPVFAYEMLSPIAYLRPALDIPYCHHEKWDGTGYSRGLMGEAIPLAARIFAIVDVWDALRSDRPYRSRWPDREVYEYIESQAGLHFDPKVVELFLRIGVII